MKPTKKTVDLSSLWETIYVDRIVLNNVPNVKKQSKESIELRDELIEIVMAEVEKLPDKKRKTLELWYFTDKTQGEIAKELGVTQGNISQRLFIGFNFKDKDGNILSHTMSVIEKLRDNLSKNPRVIEILQALKTVEYEENDEY